MCAPQSVHFLNLMTLTIRPVLFVQKREIFLFYCVASCEFVSNVIWCKRVLINKMHWRNLKCTMNLKQVLPNIS